MPFAVIQKLTCSQSGQEIPHCTACETLDPLVLYFHSSVLGVSFLLQIKESDSQVLLHLQEKPKLSHTRASHSAEFFYLVFAVVYVCCKWEIFRKLMVEFWRLGHPLEEYAFFFIDLFGKSLQSQPAKPWAHGDADDNAAMEAFKVSFM